MVSAKNRALIIGAGPGGLTAAIALRDAGFEPVVFERAIELKEAGSGLTLWPNAIKALSLLNLDNKVWGIGFSSDGIAMRNWRGQLLFRVQLGELIDQSLEVYGVAVHRSELLEVLLNELGTSRVKLGTKCAGFRQEGDQVNACFEDGTEVSGDLLIGADGIHSAIRSQLFGERRLRYRGYTVWRGVTQFKLHESAGLTTMGRGSQFGLFQMSRDRVYWFASVNARQGEKDRPASLKRDLLSRFKGWHKPVEAVIGATDESAIIRSDICDMDPLSGWSRGRVTLLGDAAHPSTPNLGQGACQAIEDAVVLADSLQKFPDVPKALEAYEAVRSKRTSAITLQSRRLGSMGRWQHPLACWFRELMIKKIPARVRVHQLNQLFRFES